MIKKYYLEECFINELVAIIMEYDVENINFEEVRVAENTVYTTLPVE